jgi:hypothetical protein
MKNSKFRSEVTIKWAYFVLIYLFSGHGRSMHFREVKWVFIFATPLDSFHVFLGSGVRS